MTGHQSHGLCKSRWGNEVSRIHQAYTHFIWNARWSHIVIDCIQLISSQQAHSSDKKFTSSFNRNHVGCKALGCAECSAWLWSQFSVPLSMWRLDVLWGATYSLHANNSWYRFRVLWEFKCCIFIDHCVLTGSRTFPWPLQPGSDSFWAITVTHPRNEQIIECLIAQSVGT